MTRGHCIDYWHKWKREGNFCGLRKQDAEINDTYLSFVEKISGTGTGLDSDFVFDHFTAGAARPLIRCKDDDIKTKALNYVVACLKRGEDVTGGDLESTINTFQGKPKKESTHLRVEEPSVPVEKPTASGLNQVPTALTPEVITDTTGKVSPPTDRPATVKDSLTAQEPVKIRPPCLDGKPCPDPDGRDHVVEEKFTRGKVCDLWGLPINQLPRDECALIVRQQRAEAQGFVRATGAPSPLPKIARYPMLPKDKWDEATDAFIDGCLRDKYHTIIKRATGDHGREYPEPLDVITHGLDLVQEEMDRMEGE